MITVYYRRGYRDVVEKVNEESMQKAIEEVKMRADYDSCGEVIVLFCTDCYCNMLSNCSGLLLTLGMILLQTLFIQLYLVS